LVSKLAFKWVNLYRYITAEARLGKLDPVLGRDEEVGLLHHSRVSSIGV
jgi:hypothetical protein